MYFIKVHILWAGHNFLKSPPIICPMNYQSNNWWRFRKILRPSQKIWTLKYDNLIIWYSKQEIVKTKKEKVNIQIDVKLLERILGWKISEGTLYSSSSILCWAFSFRSYSGCLMRYENREIQVPCTLLPSVQHSPFLTWIFKMHQIFMRWY